MNPPGASPMENKEKSGTVMNPPGASPMENKEKSGTVILVCGAVSGMYKLLFSKVEKYLAKAPCEYLFCTGEFFGQKTDELTDLLAGKIKVPIPTYIIGSSMTEYEKYHEKVKSVDNLFYLGRKGCLRLTSGLKIAYLSGIEKPGFPREPKYLCEEDVNDLIKSVQSEAIDILLTSSWPDGITKNVPPFENEKDIKGSLLISPLISKLAKALKPRYHFCGPFDFLYERVPYRNHIDGEEMPVPVTRFYGLPSLRGNAKKKVLAFNLTPASMMDSKKLNEVSGPTTACPYGASDTQFFFDTVRSGAKHTGRHADDGQQRQKIQALDPANCWFCIANKNLDKHLIIEVGEFSYLALCKGGLVPEHILIIPINHVSSYIKLPSDVQEEMTQFKVTLVEYFENQNKDVVIFERNYKSPHMCYQVVPVPKGKKDAFRAQAAHFAEVYDVYYVTLPKFDVLMKILEPDEQYFFMEIYINTIREAGFVYRFVENKSLPLQLGRIFLARENLLNMQERVNWKLCEDIESEEKIVKKLKKELLAYKK